MTHPGANRSSFQPGRISGPIFSLYTMIGAPAAGASTPAPVPRPITHGCGDSLRN